MTSVDLFTLPPIDYKYDAHRFVRYSPTLTGIDPITFSIPQTDDFVDLADSRLEIEVHFTNPAAGYNGIAMNDAVSDANNTRNTYVETYLGHTLFKQMDLSLNGALVTPQGGNYHHQSYIENLLNYSREDGRTKLVAEGWWTNDLNVQRTIARSGVADDTPNAGRMTAIAPGMYTLTGLLQQKRWMTFVIRPHLPVFTSGRLLVPGVELKLDLHLNPMSQLLFQTGNLGNAATRKVPIISSDDIKVTLILKKVTLNAKIYLDLQKRRASGKTIIHYPVVKSDIRTFSIPQGQTRWEQDNLFLSRVPEDVVLVFMHSEVYNGHLERHTFCYERHDIQRISQSIDGEEYPYKALDLSVVTDNEYSTDYKGYERLLTSMGVMHSARTPMIYPNDWGQDGNCTIFYFNNVPSGVPNNPLARNPRKTGNVRYTVEFEAATTYNITVLVYSSMEHDLRINYQGGVQYDLLA